MSINLSKESIYEKRIHRFSKIKKSWTQLSSFYSLVRLLFFLLCTIIFIFSYKISSYYLTLFSILLFIIGFIYISKKHSTIKSALLKVENLIHLNDLGVKRINGDYKNFYDGNDLKEENPLYSEDLDILGKNSLFQKICSSITPLGKKRLRDELCGDIDFQIDEIKERQSSIEELNNKLSFCQRFLAEGMNNPKGFSNPEELIKWGESENPYFLKSYIKPLCNIMTILIIGSLILPLFLRNFTFAFAKISIALSIMLLLINLSKISNSLEKVLKYNKDIANYSNMISYLEKATFKSFHLTELQNKLKFNNDKSATFIIKLLDSLASKISDRSNMFYWPLNIILLWDYRTCYELEKFKKLYGKSLKTMVEVIGEFEALISLTNINRDNSNWCMPTFEENKMIVKAVDLGHPLLGDNSICNSITIDENKKVILITGSNMAGKSTMLRTVGINLVLAYVGTKVRGNTFICSKLKLITCMRTSDNLEESISSFYAEILRIKTLIDETNVGYKVFFLLDEIFKGTNSIDRHTGAKILINQLSNKATLGMVSTHDLELGELYRENPTVKNYHFREYYRNNKIFFDYKLREGVSDTRNALYLMKMAGIEIE